MSPHTYGPTDLFNHFTKVQVHILSGKACCQFEQLWLNTRGHHFPMLVSFIRLIPESVTFLLFVVNWCSILCLFFYEANIYCYSNIRLQYYILSDECNKRDIKILPFMLKKYKYVWTQVHFIFLLPSRSMNLKTMKYLQQLKYPWSVRFPMIKKSLYFAKVTLEF